MTPRIMLAKYVPDISRMEPRNIGVFVWSKGELRARFLDVADAPFVNEPQTYDRWIKYWFRLISADAIRPVRGKPIPKTDPACMDALLATQEGNYILVDSGEMLDKITRRDLPKAVNYLFSELVAVPKSERRRA